MKRFFLQLGLLFTLSLGVLLTACNNQPKDSKIASDFGEKAKLNHQLLSVTATVTEGIITLARQSQDANCTSSAEQAAREIKGVKSVVNTIVVSPTTAPVVVADDNTLKNNVDEAIKPYKDVTADVQNGEITLRGSIVRDDLQKLMMDLNGLNPKKVTNQLTVK